jgi:hypothetical protein
VPPASWDRLFDLCRSARARGSWGKLQKLAGVLGNDTAGYYRELIAQWTSAWSLVEGAGVPEQVAFGDDVRRRLGDELSWMQYADSVTNLSDDILTKIDRASRAVRSRRGGANALSNVPGRGAMARQKLFVKCAILVDGGRKGEFVRGTVARSPAHGAT